MWFVSFFYMFKSYLEYIVVIGVILFVFGISFFFIYGFLRFIVRSFNVMYIKKVFYFVVVVFVVIFYFLMGWMGVVVFFVLIVIGLMVVVFNMRRSYCFGGFILLVFFSMIGYIEVFMYLFGLG